MTVWKWFSGDNEKNIPFFSFMKHEIFILSKELNEESKMEQIENLRTQLKR